MASPPPPPPPAPPDWTATLTRPPPPCEHALLSFPAPHTLLVTINRPRQLNCINTAGHAELDRVWSWLDAEPALRVGIITGAGRAFCAGADLKEWNDRTAENAHAAAFFMTGTAAEPSLTPAPLPLDTSNVSPASDFGGLSRRRGKKPVIAAVNGLAHGGGCEMLVNCDLVVASPAAKFAFPEVKRGVAAIAGALPRLVNVVGRMRAMDLALSGREIGAQEALAWGLCNVLAPDDHNQSVVDLAVQRATEIAANSPDSVIVSKAGIDLGCEGRMSVEQATEYLISGLWRQAEAGGNVREGVLAFVERRQPQWIASKL